jgi:hypothetical protein
MEEDNKPVEEPKTEEPKEEALSIVDEAKKVRDEIKAENDRREEILQNEQKLRSEQLLAGTGGGNVPPEKPKKLTDEEYAEAMDRGEVNPLKDDGIT